VTSKINKASINALCQMIININSMIEPIDIFTNCQKIFISGSVGVGKTTFIEMFTKSISRDNETNVHVIPEYIDGDPNGNKMLQDYLNHSISAYEFQNYVVTFYDKYIMSIINTIKAGDVIVFERLPDESIAIFANIALKRGYMTEQEFDRLYYKVIEIDTKFGIPSIFNNRLYPYVFSCIKTLSDCNLTRSVLAMQAECNCNLIVGLYNTTDMCYKRVIKRNRDSEASYTYADIEVFVKLYLKIYNKVLCNQDILLKDVKYLTEDVII